MTFTEVFLFGVGLSMDAFAVSVCKGLCMKKIKYSNALVIALFFGFFQALMPLLGYYLGKTFERYITSIDHWIAFVLLAYIGIKMIRDAFGDDDEVSCPAHPRLNLKELFVLAVATSIDALAVGIAFSFTKTNIYESILIIGTVTFALSFCGVVIGNKFGSRFKQKAQVSGGAILVLLGIKLLCEGVGLL